MRALAGTMIAMKKSPSPVKKSRDRLPIARLMQLRALP